MANDTGSSSALPSAEAATATAAAEAVTMEASQSSTSLRQGTGSRNPLLMRRLALIAASLGLVCLVVLQGMVSLAPHSVAKLELEEAAKDRHLAEKKQRNLQSSTKDRHLAEKNQRNLESSTTAETYVLMGHGACRGRSSAHNPCRSGQPNKAQWCTTHKPYTGTEAECQGLCTAGSTCLAYEFLAGDRCELWIQIPQATSDSGSSVCYKKQDPTPAPTPDPTPAPTPATTAGTYVLVGHGACRGRSSAHNPCSSGQPNKAQWCTTYKPYTGTEAECQGLCTARSNCLAYEFLTGDRCELWIQIPQATSDSGSSVCYKKQDPTPAPTPAVTWLNILDADTTCGADLIFIDEVASEGHCQRRCNSLPESAYMSSAIETTMDSVFCMCWSACFPTMTRVRFISTHSWITSTAVWATFKKVYPVGIGVWGYVPVGRGACRGKSSVHDPCRIGQRDMAHWCTRMHQITEAGCQGLCTARSTCLAYEFLSDSCELWSRVPQATSGLGSSVCKKKQATLAPTPAVLGDLDMNACPGNSRRIADEWRCQLAGKSLGHSWADDSIQTHENYPKGCFLRTPGMIYFNKHVFGSEETLSTPICEIKPAVLGELNMNACPGNSLMIADADACQSASISLGKSWPLEGDSDHDSMHPKGCYLETLTGNMHYNTHGTGGADRGSQPVCEFQAAVAGALETNDCPENSVMVADATACAIIATTIPGKTFGGVQNRYQNPKGCYEETNNNRLFFNTHPVGTTSYSQKPWCEMQAALLIGDAGANSCPGNSLMIADADGCQSAAISLAGSWDATDLNDNTIPRGCITSPRGFMFNTHESGGTNQGAKPVCEIQKTQIAN